MRYKVMCSLAGLIGLAFAYLAGHPTINHATRGWWLNANDR